MFKGLFLIMPTSMIFISILSTTNTKCLNCVFLFNRYGKNEMLTLSILTVRFE